jgi:hypothetical protein
MFGQMRAFACDEPPLQVAENVAVVSNVVFAVRLTVPNVWPGRALQEGVPRPTNVRAASMY